MEYRREIDGLRGLAVLPVILFHAGFEAFRGGFVGVDVFFVISGYLITSIMLAELEKGGFSIVRFYQRRAARILPALFLVMLVSIPFAWIWLHPVHMKDFSQSLAFISVFASNILFWRESGYFDTVADLKPLLHTWSLAVEEQYYVLFPLFLIAVWRLGKKKILVLLAALLAISLITAEWASAATPSAAFFLLPTRGWEILLGAVTAVYLSTAHRSGFGRKLEESGGWIGLALILGSVFAYDKTTPFPGLYALMPTVGTSLVILFSTKHTTAGRFIGSPPFVGAGLVSYSAYLWHQPLFALARHRSPGELGDFLMAALSVISLAIAYVSWKYVETPFRKGVVGPKALAYLAVSISGLFITLGYWGHRSEGFAFRFQDILQGDVGHVQFHQHLDERYYDCEPDTVAKRALRWSGYLRCKQSRKGRPDVVLLGDSHAEHLFLGFAEKKPHLNIAFYIYSGVPFVSNPDFKFIYDELLSNNKAQHVVFTMHFVESMTKIRSIELHEGLSSSIRVLKNAGKTVWLVGDIPRYYKDASHCKYAVSSSTLPSACYMPMSAALSQRLVYQAMLRQLSSVFDIVYFEPDSSLCSASGCAMTDGKSILYRDNNHLNIPGSKFVGGYVAEKLPF